MGSVEEEERSLMGLLGSQSFFCGLERVEETILPTEEIFCFGDSSLSTLTSSSSSTAIITSNSHITKEATTTDRTNKKQKKGASASLGTIKVRKDRLGARISALQQLVSPYGKSDTASVLHEALGYIRFLHEQVQVLSSPYLQRLPTAASLQEEVGEESRACDLRSKGLCLVPITSTEEVANDNGADLWSPAMASNIYTKH